MMCALNRALRHAISPCYPSRTRTSSVLQRRQNGHFLSRIQQTRATGSLRPCDAIFGWIIFYPLQDALDGSFLQTVILNEVLHGKILAFINVVSVKLSNDYLAVVETERLHGISETG